jgi:D-threo-aldose 1-dehydrogenase
VSLRTAALRYPMTVDGVTSVIVGMSSPTEVDDNVASLHSAIPPALWSDLAAVRYR